MNKSIANLYRYVKISKSIIKKYIDALPQIDLDKAPFKEINDISYRKELKGRAYSEFNLLSSETLLLFKLISSGKYLINEFSNKCRLAN